VSEHVGVDLVVVSPHLDDAALSVGGTLHALARRGCRVVVATVFTADEPASPPSEVARKLQRLWGGERVMASRRSEDEESCSVLGVGWRHLGLADALFRSAPNGEAHYQSLKALFRTPRRGDLAVADEVAVALGRLNPKVLLAPLGVGGHVDHRHARKGAEQVAATVRCPIVFYEDFPYAEAAWPRWRAHRRLVGGAVSLDERDVAARLAAIAAFRSQVAPLFGDTAKLERRVRRQLARRGGERLWAASGTDGLRLLTDRAGAVA
jgi:LmbE family N-acetylglucosaminyl deacetylase